MILFRKQASDLNPGGKCFLNGYKTPFEVLDILNNWVKIKHLRTGQIKRLSFGYPVWAENKGMAKVLGIE